MSNLSLQELAWGYLEKLYELSNGGLHPEVDAKQAESELGLSREVARGVIEYLLNKGLISFDCRVTCVRITTRGIDEVYQAKRFPDRGTQHFPAHIINNYTVNIQGDNQGNIAQAGQGNNQSVINHQPISEILPRLAELIEAVKRADFEDRDEVVRDLEKAQQLAQSEDPKSKWALIQSKLSSAKTGMELVGYGYNSLPYWPMIWQYFFG